MNQRGGLKLRIHHYNTATAPKRKPLAAPEKICAIIALSHQRNLALSHLYEFVQQGRARMSDRHLPAPDKSAGAPKQKRVNRGYKLREDVIKELKLIAVYEDRNLYQVMEEAIEQYLERRGTARPPQAGAPARSE
jgi:hypothetical protein